MDTRKNKKKEFWSSLSFVLICIFSLLLFVYFFGANTSFVLVFLFTVFSHTPLGQSSIKFWHQDINPGLHIFFCLLFLLAIWVLCFYKRIPILEKILGKIKIKIIL